MPAFELLLALPHLSRLAPVVAFADVPGVNLDDQGKGFGRWVPRPSRFVFGLGRKADRCVHQALAHDQGAVSLALGFTRQGAATQGTSGHAQGKGLDRKSTRLNSSHLGISYAVF